MQMCHRLSQGKGDLVKVQWALEQHRQDVGGAARFLCTGQHHLGQALAVVVVQLLDADVQTRKRFAMRGQHQGVGGLVIGLPLNMDGSEGPSAQSARAFARNFAARSALPIALCDERLSTAAVTRTLLEADASRQRRAALVDKMAAAYILQGALDRMRLRDK